MNTLLHTQALDIGYLQSKTPRTVQENITVNLKAGELTCLLGPNGAGKSTLLRTFCGFQKPLSGSIELLHRPITSYTEAELAKTISVVLTEKTDVFNMSVHQVVALGRSPYTGFFGRLDHNDNLRVDKALHDIGIQHMAHRFLHELSDGERQKVMIAKALVQETPIILLDEPTAFLDLPSKMEIMQLLRNLATQHNKAVMLSTHNMELALRFGDKLWLIGPQRPMEAGVPEDLVLSNSINHFFKKKGIRFDMLSGSFILDSKKGRAITLHGEGTATEWVSRALVRNGFIPSQKINHETHISVIQQGADATYKFTHQNEMTTHHSIETLIEHLKTTLHSA